MLKIFWNGKQLTRSAPDVFPEKSRWVRTDVNNSDVFFLSRSQSCPSFGRTWIQVAVPRRLMSPVHGPYLGVVKSRPHSNTWYGIHGNQYWKNGKMVFCLTAVQLSDTTDQSKDIVYDDTVQWSIIQHGDFNLGYMCISYGLQIEIICCGLRQKWISPRR